MFIMIQKSITCKVTQNIKLVEKLIGYPKISL